MIGLGLVAHSRPAPGAQDALALVDARVCASVSSIISSKQRVAFSWFTELGRRRFDEGGRAST